LALAERGSMSKRAETGDGRRSLAKEGLQVRINFYLEMWREVKRYIEDAKDDVRIRARVGGERILPGETQGISRGFGALVAWFLHLSDEDRARVWSEGADLFQACDDLGKGYAENKLPFRQRAESVFAVNDAKAAAPMPVPVEDIDHPGREAPRNGGKRPRKRG
jgi:hypothetical protein